jgi:hypothetical protein
VIDAAGYIITARKLLRDDPSEVDIRRSTSTAYYALFHHLCWHFSAVVQQPHSGTYVRAWLQAYRYIDHGSAKQRCIEAQRPDRRFPLGVQKFSNTFIDLQQRRAEADYDPWRTDYDPFNVITIASILNLISDAEAAIAAFDAEPEEARRAFVVFVALKPKNRA